MQNEHRITSNSLGIALGLAGLAAAVAQVALPAVGIELTPQQGRALLVLAGVLFAGALVALFWPWFKRGWLRLRRDAEIQQLNAKLEVAEKECERLEKELEKTRSQQVADAKTLWFSIPTTEIAQDRYIRLLSGPERVKADNQQSRTEIPQRDNENVKQHLLWLSGELFQFSEKRNKEGDLSPRGQYNPLDVIPPTRGGRPGGFDHGRYFRQLAVSTRPHK